VTMAILAVFVAIVSLLGTARIPKDCFSRIVPSDQWATTRRKTFAGTIMRWAWTSLHVGIQRTRRRRQGSRKISIKKLSVYTKEQSEIEEQAKDLEKESALAQRKANRFDLGEYFWKSPWLISSLSLLSRNRFYWFLGIASGLAGWV